MLDFSVVICTYNGQARIGQVLERLQAQIETDRFSWEVLVVDNNSTDETQATITHYQRRWNQLFALKSAFEPRQGLAFARSRAVQAASGRWIAFLDDDTLPSEDWVAQAYRFAQTHPKMGAFGGQIHGDYEVQPPPELKKLAPYLAIVERGATAHRYDRVLPPGAGLVVQRQVWLDCVPTETVLVGRTTAMMLASEDIEAILHIQKAGWEIWYNPNMHLYHQIPAWRMERSYLLKLIKGVGLARHHIRMTRWAVWQRPLIMPIYLANDLRKLAAHTIQYRNKKDLAIVCEGQLLVSSLISPFYFCRRFFRQKYSL